DLLQFFPRSLSPSRFDTNRTQSHCCLDFHTFLFVTQPHTPHPAWRLQAMALSTLRQDFFHLNQFTRFDLSPFVKWLLNLRWNVCVCVYIYIYICVCVCYCLLVVVVVVEI